MKQSQVKKSRKCRECNQSFIATAAEIEQHAESHNGKAAPSLIHAGDENAIAELGKALLPKQNIIVPKLKITNKKTGKVITV